jgi:hypothetical protein
MSRCNDRPCLGLQSASRYSKKPTLYWVGWGILPLLADMPVNRLALGSNGWFRRRLNRFLFLCLLRGSRRSSNCYWLRLSLGGCYFRFRGTTYDLLCWKHLEAVLSQVFQNAITVSGCSAWDQAAIYSLVGNVAGVDAFRVARIRDFDEFNNLFRWVSASLTQPLQIVVSGWF